MIDQKDPWHSINNIDEVDSPALVLYPQRVKANIRLALGMVGNVQRLRPHVKTNKCVETVVLMMDEGIHKFKCATIAEAEMMGMCKADDVLLAYQPVGPKLERFTALIKKYPNTKYSCLADSAEAATEMAAVFSGNGLTIPVYLDINVGQNRTGILPEHGLELYIQCSTLKGISPVGLHVYDGHIRETDFVMRKQKCDECFESAVKLKNEIIKAGFAEPVVVAGGSPTFSIHCKRENVECSPGTFVYWDKGYTDLCPEQNFLPAALVISRVISLPAENKLCLDLGHKSVAAENEITKRVFFLNAPELKAISQSEEHLVVEAGAGHRYKVGDVLYGIPLHICPTIALYERAIAINDHVANGEWMTIGRDRKITV
ncbi:MAG: D-TA family PLP-dependent enzyme [Bacteroidetes bacterium]|nr:D-TA family PLP-dependent enzyme [Bacteroidota bacterium]MBS1975163.1 D-TA family PLP-dependent enzyme [Bacteroidota bacterium]